MKECHCTTSPAAWAFEGWQTAGLNALKTKSCGLSGVGKGVASGRLWPGAVGGAAEGLGNFEGWQTAGLNALQSMPWRWLKLKALQAAGCGQELVRGGGKGLGSFESWHTAGLNSLEAECCGVRGVGQAWHAAGCGQEILGGATEGLGSFEDWHPRQA